MNKKYIVKFLLRGDEKKVGCLSPAMDLREAQRIVRDLELMLLTAWAEEQQ